MKTKAFLLPLLCSLAFSSLPGQDYRPLYPEMLNLYEDPMGKIISLRLDTIEVHSDELGIYHFGPNIRGLEGDTPGDEIYTPYGPSWMGKPCVFTREALSFYPKRYPENNAYITIPLNIQVGESHTCWKSPSNDSVTVVLNNHDTLSFLGVTDSVRFYTFTGYMENENVNQKINSLQLWVSKNYGLVRTPNFYFFPDEISWERNSELQTLSLTGSSAIESSLQNLEYLDVYDYQPGDEVHILKKSDGQPMPMSSNNLDESTRKEIWKILSARKSPDSSVYEIERVWSHEILYFDRPGTYEAGSDTLVKTYHRFPTFDAPPGEPVIEDNSMLYYYMRNGSMPDKIRPRVDEARFRKSDSHWHKERWFDFPRSEEVYKKAVGGPYYSEYVGFTGYSFGVEPVYFKNRFTEWGIPLQVDLSVKELPSGQTPFLLIPNPAEKQLFIRNTRNQSDVTLVVYDITGQKKLISPISLTETSILLPRFRAGLYICKFLQEDKELYTTKFILQ